MVLVVVLTALGGFVLGWIGCEIRELLKKDRRWK